jgi:ubiquinone/menaquinone biosynthesis C-methylase UbiE
VDHADHVALIRDAVAGGGEVWADLGSGTGAFTLALADILGPGAVIHSVDRDRAALRRQAELMGQQFPEVTLLQQPADFTRPLELPTLDGLLMANSLHFVADKLALLPRLLIHLRPGGHFVLVEYDADAGNTWVPHPVSYRAWEAMAEQLGLRATRRVASVPSRFHGSIYAALSLRW